MVALPVEIAEGLSKAPPTGVLTSTEPREPRVVGTRHLQMTLTKGGVDRDAIGFNLGDREIPDGPLDIAFQVRKNTFRGVESIQLSLRDFRPSEG